MIKTNTQLFKLLRPVLNKSISLHFSTDEGRLFQSNIVGGKK